MISAAPYCFWLRRIFILTVSILCSGNLAQSQNYAWPSDLWHEGKMVLTSGDTLKGMLKYDLKQDLVQYTSQTNSSPDAFSVRKVLFFEIFDTSISRYRRFFALPYLTSHAYKTPKFFELLEEGKITLLAREFLEYRTSGTINGVSFLVLSHDFFLMNENGTIEEFSGSRNDLLNMMGKHRDKVEKFMRANRLDQDYKEDFTRIIDYYNSLAGF